MTFQEMKKEDSSFLKYELLKIQMTLHAEVPVEVVRISNKKNVKFIVIKQNKNNAISTKAITVPLGDCVFFDSWFSGDFPDVPVQLFDSRKGGVADEPSKNNG